MSFADSWYRASCALFFVAHITFLHVFFLPPPSFSLSLSLSLCLELLHDLLELQTLPVFADRRRSH